MTTPVELINAMAEFARFTLLIGTRLNGEISKLTPTANVEIMKI